jgi:hypothetical protein
LLEEPGTLPRLFLFTKELLMTLSETHKLVQQELEKYDESICQIAKKAMLSQDKLRPDALRSIFCKQGTKVVREAVDKAFRELPTKHPLWVSFIKPYRDAVRSFSTEIPFEQQEWWPLWKAFLAGADWKRIDEDDSYDDYDDEEP